MPFLQGSVSFQRFAVSGEQPGLFDADHLELLASSAAGRSRLASADGSEIGWSAGQHVLDTDFAPEKNIYPGFLAFDFRIDTDKLPADKLKAYYEVELKALIANNPSGLPSARQRREAKEAARDRLEQEAKDGRFRKQKCIPVLWCAARNEVLFGTTSFTQVARFCLLFEQTFGRQLTPITSGTLAHAEFPNAEPGPSPFVPGISPPTVAWIADEAGRDYLGNEFALWLWWHLETEGDSVEVPGGDITVMFARRLILDCPRGQTGRDGFAHEGPTRLPEAKRAIQSGKMPRKFGLTIVRHDQQFAFQVEAETLAIGSGKLPPAPDDVIESRAKIEHRLAATVELIEAVEGLYRHFLTIRLDRGWSAVLTKMQQWLAKEHRQAA